MKTALIAGTALLLSTAAAAASLSETIDRTFDARPGATVVLNNVNGRIAVSSWDQPRVRVVAEKEVEGGRADVKEMLRALRVEMEPRDGGVVVTTHHPKRVEGAWSIFDWIAGNHENAQVRYEVTVPRTMNLVVSNTNGSVRLDGINGVHELETTNGKIEVSRSAGSVEASTTNGAIAVELLSVAAGKPMRLSTTNGRIEMTVPRNAAVDVDASTTNGTIRSDLPVATTRAGGRSLRGTINGGGTPLRLRTTNGGISIRSAGNS